MKKITLVAIILLILSACQRTADSPSSNDPFLEYDLNGKHFEIQGNPTDRKWISCMKVSVEQYNPRPIYLFEAVSNVYDQGNPDNGYLSIQLNADTLLISHMYILTNDGYFRIGTHNYFKAGTGYPVNLTLTKYSNATIDGYFSGTLYRYEDNGTVSTASLTGSFKNVHMSYR